MFEGEKVTLRGLEINDVDELMKHWNNKEVRRFLHNITPNSRQEEIEWIKNTWKRRQQGSYVYGIIDKESNLYIGNIELIIENPRSNRGELGIAIFNQRYWGKGYGTEALKLLIEHSFNDLNLNSIQLSVLETNERAIACYKKVGLKEVGKLRKAEFFEGNYIDLLLMDILRE